MAFPPLARRRAQSNTEFIIVIAAVLTMLVAFAVPAFQAYEGNVALASARVGLQAYIAQNRSLTLGPLGYNVTGNQFTIRPHVYYNGTTRLDDSWSDGPNARAAALQAIATALRQNSIATSDTTTTGFTYRYTINFSG
jgi:Tfp pilus assembly protein FimT